MDLSQGICALCTNNTKIIVPPQAEDKTSLIKDILADHIDCEKFEEINTLLKVCPICLQDILTVAQFKESIKDGPVDSLVHCILCYEEENLVRIGDWTHFDTLLEYVRTEKRFSKCTTCLNCIKCLDLFDRIKTNLLKKYPKLTFEKGNKKYGHEKSNKSSSKPKSSRSTPKKTQADTFIEISSDEEPTIRSRKSRCVDNLKSALRHLKPLKNTRFNIDDFVEDQKLLEQVAFVKLNLSDLSKMDYRTSKRHVKSSGRKKYIDCGDSDSSQDSSPKQSFFKIKLKINQNKVKLHKISSGKVKKSKAQTKFLTGDKKELVVKILKTDLKKIKEEQDQIREIRTPTKASRKMMPEKDDSISLSSSKKRKSVTFADVLEITEDRPYQKNHEDATPPKSSLKRSVDLLKNGNYGSDDESDTGYEKNTLATEPEKDSDEELDPPKSYVEEIQKHNDDIFNSLKSSESTKVTPEKSKEESESNSEDDTQKAKNKKHSKNDIKSKKGTNSNKGKSAEVSSSDSDDSEIKEQTNDKKVKPVKADKMKETKSNPINISDSEDEGSKSETNKEDIVSKERENSEDENNSDDINTTKNNGQLSSESESESNTDNKDKEKKSKIGKNDAESANNKKARRKKISSPNKDADKIDKKVKNVDSDSESIESFKSIEEEFDISFKIPDADDVAVDNDPLQLNLEASDKVNVKEDTELSKPGLDTEDIVNEKEASDHDGENSSKQKDKETIDEKNSKRSSDIESDAEESNKNGAKPRKRRKSTVDREEENEEFEEPETKKEKVSEDNNLTDAELENQDVQTTKENTTKEPKSAGAVGNDIDELIAKYSNPFAPNLPNNDDNVLDSQDAGPSSKDEGSDELSTELDNVADEDTNDKEDILGISDGNTKDDTNLLKNNSEGDITS